MSVWVRHCVRVFLLSHADPNGKFTTNLNKNIQFGKLKCKTFAERIPMHD